MMKPRKEKSLKLRNDKMTIISNKELSSFLIMMTIGIIFYHQLV